MTVKAHGSFVKIGPYGVPFGPCTFSSLAIFSSKILDKILLIKEESHYLDTRDFSRCYLDKLFWFHFTNLSFSIRADYSPYKYRDENASAPIRTQ